MPTVTRAELAQMLSDAALKVEAITETVLTLPPNTEISLPPSHTGPVRDPWIDFGCDLNITTPAHSIDPVIVPEDLVTALLKTSWLINAVRTVVLRLPAGTTMGGTY